MNKPPKRTLDIMKRLGIPEDKYPMIVDLFGKFAAAESGYGKTLTTAKYNGKDITSNSKLGFTNPTWDFTKGRIETLIPDESERGLYEDIFNAKEARDVDGDSLIAMAVLHSAKSGGIPFKKYLRGEATEREVYKGFSNATEANKHLDNFDDKMIWMKEKNLDVKSSFDLFDMDYPIKTIDNPNNLQDVREPSMINGKEAPPQTDFRPDYLRMLPNGNEYAYGGLTDITGSGTTFTDSNVQGDNAFAKVNTEQEIDPTLSFRGEQFQAPKPNSNNILESLVGNTVGILGNEGIDFLQNRQNTQGVHNNSFASSALPSNLSVDMTQANELGSLINTTNATPDMKGSSFNMQGTAQGVAGIAGSLLQSFIPKEQVKNNIGIQGSSNYDWGTQRGTGRSEEYFKDMQKQSKVYDYASIIPFVGLGRAIGEGARSLSLDSQGRETAMTQGVEAAFNPVGSIINSHKRSDINGPGDFFKQFTPEKLSYEDQMADYMSFKRPEIQARQKGLYDAAFAEKGGSFGGSDYLELTSPELKSAGAYPIVGQDTHKQNEQGGYTFSMSPDGTPNKASEGEFIVDGPSKQKLVFTNKF